MSLVQMTAADMPVPPGITLTVDYFAPWLEAVLNSREWTQVLASPPEELKERTDSVKNW